jgi:hypothetical protein
MAVDGPWPLLNVVIIYTQTAGLLGLAVSPSQAAT